ncbi:MAG: hypothetical protein ACFB0Z_02705 [Candidatus Phaeomarinobacter sp.]
MMFESQRKFLLVVAVLLPAYPIFLAIDEWQRDYPTELSPFHQIGSLPGLSQFDGHNSRFYVNQKTLNYVTGIKFAILCPAFLSAILIFVANRSRFEMMRPSFVSKHGKNAPLIALSGVAFFVFIWIHFPVYRPVYRLHRFFSLDVDRDGNLLRDFDFFVFLLGAALIPVVFLLLAFSLIQFILQLFSKAKR